MIVVTKEEATILLAQQREILRRIVHTADAADPDVDFLISKTSRANLRHDAMTHKASLLLGDEWRRCDDSRTCMWVGPQYVLRFRKIEANGSVGGYRTERAQTLKILGQLPIFGGVPAENPPIFNVGYQADPDTGEVLDFLISMYVDDEPAWVMTFDELDGAQAPVQLPIMNAQPMRRTVVRMRDTADEDDAT